jgi:hypothetical protein
MRFLKLALDALLRELFGDAAKEQAPYLDVPFEPRIDVGKNLKLRKVLCFDRGIAFTKTPRDVRVVRLAHGCCANPAELESISGFGGRDHG